MKWLVGVVVLYAGCITSTSVRCDDGSLCRRGTVCDIVHSLCVTDEQATACAGLSDGDLCHADDRDARCDRGVCLPTCGDGVLDEGEQCDDGGYMSHDGCSSSCVAETLAWEPWQSPWVGRALHGATYDSDRRRLVVFGGRDTSNRGDTWERRELPVGSTWEQVTTPVAPSARTTELAYDPVRKVVVLFGGFDSVRRNDTWEYDGTTWTQRTLAVSPPARSGHAMVFDPGRGKVVMFGGTDGVTTYFGDTWTYDGAWTQIASTGPSPRVDAAMAYDPARSRVVLFGGTGVAVGSDTWELTGTWTEVTAASHPDGRAGAAMAYSNADGALVLFGGAGVAGRFSDTWRYDGAWSQKVLVEQPATTTAHSLTTVTDVAGSRLVLVGGLDPDANPSPAVYEYDGGTRWIRTIAPAVAPSPNTCDAVDSPDGMMMIAADEAVWRFDGASWRVVASPLLNPGTRTGAAVAYDTSRAAMVVAGGFLPGTGFRGDTWLFDGSVFADVSTAGDPAPRGGASAAYDASRGVTVLVGGNNNSITFDETWERDTTWHPISVATAPEPQHSAPMAYDPIAKRIVLLANSGDTWAYTGTWTKLAVARLVPNRTRATMTFDPWRGRLVVFGGRDDDRNVYDDVLELTDMGWQPRVVTGVGPSARAFACFAPVRGAHALAVYGGGHDDTWLLAYRSTTPDERCDGSDADADGRVDAADPDCTVP